MNVIQDLTVPCNQCIGCKLERARQWAVRVMHEASLYDQNCFVTLTYNEDNLNDPGLDYRQFQLFMKRLRKKAGSTRIRFYMCGEYGEERARPHFHVCLFNYDFPDKIFFKMSAKGSKIYTSEILTGLWPYGYSTVTPLTYETAAYAARYVMKKINGRYSKKEYEVIDLETGEVSYREKEFAHMSLKPGIGSTWYDQFKGEVFPFDRVIVKGREVKPPSYYTRKLKDQDPDLYETVQEQREAHSKAHQDDQTEDRLMVKERVLAAKIKFKERRSL